MIQSSEIHIGNKLRHLIDVRGLSKREVAQQLETTEQNLHKILYKPSIQIGQLLRFCEILKVRPEIFFIDRIADDSVNILEEDLVKYSASSNSNHVGSVETLGLYKDLIEEKDKRITELQNHIDSLKILLNK